LTYADAALDAIGDRTELLVVGQSFGGFTAQLIYDRTAVDLLVLVAGMIPSPGEAPKWWANTGYEQKAREQDEDSSPPSTTTFSPS
jgi:pimeloyl-ACP methyl ester carboxylesterase